jgi:hypothetical protein
MDLRISLRSTGEEDVDAANIVVVIPMHKRASRFMMVGES